MEYVYGTSVIGGVERENLKIVGGAQNVVILCFSMTDSISSALKRVKS